MILTAAMVGGTGIYLATRPLEPELEKSGCYIGVFRPGAPDDMSPIEGFESDVGKKVATVMWFEDFDNPFPTQKSQNVVDHGAIPHITWEPWLDWGATNIYLDNILSGQYDNYIQEWAAAAKNFGEKLFIRWAHEFNGNWYPWSIDNNDDDPTKYRDAWRHVHDIFEKAGATNVKWVWSPTAASEPYAIWNNPELAYPGDKYVDWIGITGYNFGYEDNASKWSSFFDTFTAQPIIRDLAINHPDKPMMIAEFASAEKGGGSKGDWIRSIPGVLKTSFPQIRMITWFDINKERDWRINSSLESLEAFQEIMQDNYFIDGSDGLWTASAVPPPAVTFVRGETTVWKASQPPTIDGNLNEWNLSSPARMNWENQVQSGVEAWGGASDLSGSVYLMWDESNFYIGAQVKDDNPMLNSKTGAEIWDGDALEITLSTDPNANPDRKGFSESDLQFGIRATENYATWVWRYQALGTKIYDGPTEGEKIVVVGTADGYIIEASVPWSNFLDFTPSSGVKVGFDVALDDGDIPIGRESQIVWSGSKWFYSDPSMWGWITFE